MNSAFGTLFIVGAILAALALPPALQQESWKRFGIALVLSFVGVLLPLFVFLVSAGFALTLDWKGECAHGWVDCFHLGKLALSPIVLWATAALYVADICQVTNRTRPWIVTGLFLGSIVAGICFVFGVVTVGRHGGGAVLWLVVPLYVAVWHGVRSAQLGKAAGLPSADYTRALCGSLPFWAISVLWSHKFYESLPDTAPSGCFVVTAAARGHESLVGPFVVVTHHGRTIQANKQLITLWQFELLWRTRAPLSHAAFRRVYNRIGPVVARRIALPWLADLAYIAIKPVELLAAMILISPHFSRNLSMQTFVAYATNVCEAGAARRQRRPEQVK